MSKKLNREFVMILEKYSFGIGDRFGRQGKAQLAALIKAKQPGYGGLRPDEQGLEITPVWNKSHREHTIIGTKPADTRKEADEAVASCGWKDAYFVDADHIGLKNVDLFIESSDFFTIDVADFIGKPAAVSDVESFVKKHKKYREFEISNSKFEITVERIKTVADTFLLAVKQAGKIYRHISQAKASNSFIIEVSMDETEKPQTPVEMFFILAAIADEGIPAQTIAPKFTGRFKKGVDYVGDVTKFTREFQEDLAVIAFAIKEFGLPGNLKLSIHSGSDKLSIYEPINKALKKFNAGLHLKTAGTTWLEELIGLAIAGGDGLAIAKQIYAKALSRIDELCQPYAAVIDIDRAELPKIKDVDKWDGQRFASALRHDQSCPDYNPNFRQLLHIAYKIAAEMGERYFDALDRFEDTIARNVTDNIYERHIKPVFMGP